MKIIIYLSLFFIIFPANARDFPAFKELAEKKTPSKTTIIKYSPLTHKKKGSCCDCLYRLIRGTPKPQILNTKLVFEPYSGVVPDQLTTGLMILKKFKGFLEKAGIVLQGGKIRQHDTGKIKRL